METQQLVVERSLSLSLGSPLVFAFYGLTFVFVLVFIATLIIYSWGFAMGYLLNGFSVYGEKYKHLKHLFFLCPIFNFYQFLFLNNWDNTTAVALFEIS